MALSRHSYAHKSERSATRDDGEISWAGRQIREHTSFEQRAVIAARRRTTPSSFLGAGFLPDGSYVEAGRAWPPKRMAGASTSGPHEEHAEVLPFELVDEIAKARQGVRLAGARGPLAGFGKPDGFHAAPESIAGSAHWAAFRFPA